MSWRVTTVRWVLWTLVLAALMIGWYVVVQLPLVGKP